MEITPIPPCKKKAFDSKFDAIKRIQEIQKEESSKNKKPVRAYKCKDCGKFHLTSMAKSKYIEGMHEGGFERQRLARISNYWMEKKGWK